MGVVGGGDGGNVMIEYGMMGVWRDDFVVRVFGVMVSDRKRALSRGLTCTDTCANNETP